MPAAGQVQREEGVAARTGGRAGGVQGREVSMGILLEDPGTAVGAEMHDAIAVLARGPHGLGHGSTLVHLAHDTESALDSLLGERGRDGGNEECERQQD